MLIWVWSHLGAIKDAAQTIAFLSAFIFFAYKVINGYLVVNTSIGVELVRSPVSETSDMVAVTVSLERGQLGSLYLHDVRASWRESSLRRVG